MPQNDVILNRNNLSNNLQKRHCYGKYLINEWNINGFHSITNDYNKQTVVANLYSDFWIIPEIHCLQNQSIEFESFTIYQYNRIVNTKNRRGSGGISNCNPQFCFRNAYCSWCF